jgi:hypothetical protein
MTKRKIQTIQRPRGKDRQYNDQKENTDNTMTMRKRQDNTMTKRKRLVIVLSVFSSWSLYCLSFPHGHCIVCLFLLVIVLSVFSSWSLYCLSFPKDRQYNDQEEKTDNTMTKRKRQTIQLPKGKDRQCNDQEEKTDKHCLSFPFGNCIVCLFLLVIVLSCLFLLVIVLSVFSFWSLYCLSFPLGICIVCIFLFVIVLSVLSS